MNTLNNNWYKRIAKVQSRGSQAKRPGSLAGLHAARQVHKGQFFTPEALTRFVWSLLSPSMNKAITNSSINGDRVTLFDNSVGTGRLFQFANPEKHTLTGVDIDTKALRAFTKVAQKAGFSCDLHTASMEQVRAYDYSVGIINPPFSLHLDSPLLWPYECTSYGSYGQHTSALSHVYSLYQALDACDIVAAVVPRTQALNVIKDTEINDRLVAVFHIRVDVFKEENASVQVSVVLFDSEERTGNTHIQDIKSFDDTVPAFDLTCRTEIQARTKFRLIGIEESEPSITLPVTSDKTVRVTHNSRWIHLKFNCGLTQAMVLNEIYGDRLGYRNLLDTPLPKGVQYSGQGVLDIEVHLTQLDPMSSFQSFIDSIEGVGAIPVVDQGLYNYFKRRIRQHERAITPMRHTIYSPEGYLLDASEAVSGVARKTHNTNPAQWLSPVINAGDVVEFSPDGNNCFNYDVKGQTFTINKEDLYSRFEVESKKGGWVTIHEGLHVKFPELAALYRKRALAAGLDKWLTWGFQLNDLIELAMNPAGSICSWDMGLGKARLALALCVIHGYKKSLIQTEAYLIPEMIIELNNLNVDPDSWKIINSPSDLDNLSAINIISYNRLRMPIDESRPKITYSKKLRRRIGLMVCDEGDLLSSMSSQRTKAAWNVSAKRRYILTGTPISNYPRNILPLLAFTAGNGTAAQPFSMYSYYIDKALRKTMSIAQSGKEIFLEKFVSMEWVTNEFSDTLEKGAKREIPVIRNLPEFRAMLAPHMKRRVLEEPDVAKYIQIPAPEYVYTNIDWDDEHLAYYLRVSEDFAQWYINYRADCESKKKSINLVAVLARINAVAIASNCPSHEIEGFGSYGKPTSKQRYVIDRINDLTNNGHKVVLYAKNPETLKIINAHLVQIGKYPVMFHGGITIKARTAELNERFRFGDATELLASIGVAQRGLNIPQADRVILYDRNWTAKEEMQAIKRVLRPQQKNKVVIEYAHLKGGIDIYQDQMVAFKKDTVEAGLDYGTPKLEGENFKHLDSILLDFCKNIVAMRNTNTRDLRKHLSQEVAA